MKPIIHVDSWKECENKISSIREQVGHSTLPLLYRGQSNSGWKLKSSLERRCDNQTFSVEDYYELISNIKYQIGAYTSTEWKTPTKNTLFKWTRSTNSMRATLKSYEYLAYLRHHNFPSPLLDWTHSPYVAAYFAFAHAKSEPVALYIYADRTNETKVTNRGGPKILMHGPLVRTHKRHFRQQSAYTACVEFQKDRWVFASHDSVLENKTPGQDVLWKIILPASLRTDVLKLLDSYNLNAFSLFDSEEGLMETLATREIDFQNR